MEQPTYLDVDGYDAVNENVYANDLPESPNYIAYADLVFDPGSQNACHRAFCVFETQGSPNEKMISPIMHVYTNETEVEHVLLISDGENSESDSDSDESYHSYLDIDEEIECEKLNWPKGTPEKDLQRICTSSAKKGPKEPSKLTCTGMAVLNNHRVVIVTIDGEILVFEANGTFLFLRDFPEQFENATTFADSTIAATSGFCIRFYKIVESDVLELKEKCFDFESNGFMTVHGICYNSKEFIVSCNLQSVSPKPFIRVLNKQGGITKTIELQGLLSPTYVTCTLDRKHIFVSDPKLKTIFALNRAGKIQWNKMDEETPTSLTVIPKQTLVVACQNPCSFKLYTYEGVLISKLVSMEYDIERSPVIVSYHAHLKLLLFCPETHVVGEKDFFYVLKTKKSKKKTSSKFSLR